MNRNALRYFCLIGADGRQATNPILLQVGRWRCRPSRLMALMVKVDGGETLAVCRTLGHRLSMALSPVVLASG